MTIPDIAVVVTHRSWLADEFLQGCAAIAVPATHSMGLDIPAIVQPGTNVAWWAPAFPASRIQSAGAPFHMAATPANWWTAFPERFTQRSLTVHTVEALPDALPTGQWFLKLADVKDDRIPALCTTVETFLVACQDADVHPHAVVIASPPLPPIVQEWRSFMVDGAVRSISCYRNKDWWWDGIGIPVSPDTYAEIDTFLSELSAHLAFDQPSSWVADVARLHDGRLVVVEANPSFCSAPYSTPLDVWAAAVAAAVVPPNSDWEWRPDPWLSQRAARSAKLRWDV